MSIRVVIVEDLPGMRSLLQELFASQGAFQVVAALKGEGEAKIWLEDHPQGWDVAVVDLVLSDGSGFGVISRAHEVNPAGKVIVLSSFVTDGIREHCLRIGATDVFEKADSTTFVTRLMEIARGRQGGS